MGTLLLPNDENARDIRLTIVREENGKLSISSRETGVILLDAAPIRELLAWLERTL
jgi:hypothetical protein